MSDTRMTRIDLIRALQRLTGLYAMPRYARDVEALVQAWEPEIGRGVDAQAFNDAITDYIQTSGEPYFPKLGQLLARARRLQRARPRQMAASPARAYLAWEDAWGRTIVDRGHGEEYAFTACPVCGAEVELGLRGLRVPHRAAAHREQDIPIIGYSDEVAQFYATAGGHDA